MNEEVLRYRHDGFLIKGWKRTSTLARLEALCRNVFEGRVKDGYKEMVRYGGRARDVVLGHNYDSVILDILFENDVPALLEKSFGPNAVPCHIQAITSLPPGYTNFWHVDGFVEHRIHRLFYYPCFDRVAQPTLQLLPGHYKLNSLFRSRLLKNRFVTHLEAACFKKETIRMSNEAFVLFNPETVHRAMPVTDPHGAFRLVYSFVDWPTHRAPQLIKGDYGHMTIDEKLVDCYRSRLANPYVLANAR